MSQESFVAMEDGGNMIRVKMNGELRNYAEGIRFIDIAREVQGKYKNDIVLVTCNGKLQELHKTVPNDSELSFVTTADSIGMTAYHRSTVLMLMKAIYDVVGHEKIQRVSVDFSLSRGLYCEVKGEFERDEDFIAAVKERMLELCQMNIPIEKRTINTDEAVSQFHKHRMYDKEKLFRYRRVSKVNLYRINEFEDYYYGYMVPSTGYLKYFDLFLYGEGFVIQLPLKEAPTIVPPFEPQHKIYRVMKDSARWHERLGVSTVGALNDKISQGEINELILVQEALMEKKLADIAEEIVKQKDKKFVMIAGPSSSGKTTFSHRLSIQLLAHGLKPHPIAVDDYFVDREKSPRDELGNYNFEDLECIDVELFNSDMNRLLNGETVQLPTYNFITGRREYKGNFKKLGPEDILVIEGIHCLNDHLSPSIPKEHKFRIYISALTQLNIDEHNRIPTTDGRLIRRMVRDARTRGASAKDTIAMWHNVRRGEERNIFPYQEEADLMFNSALVYELAVLKQYAEPLLFSIHKEEPEYQEAKRLLKFFDYFLGISSEDIPKNSILREFIGGSCFKV